MTRDEFKVLIDHLQVRFSVVATMLARDNEREPGDTSPTRLLAWWEAFASMPLHDCLGVARDIFAGAIERPYRADDYPATICREVKRRRSKSGSSSVDYAKQNTQAAVEHADDMTRFDRLNATIGADFDQLDRSEQERIAAESLHPANVKRWKANPSLLQLRYAILEHLEKQKPDTEPARLMAVEYSESQLVAISY